MLTSVPQGPYQNPQINDGTYSAIIRNIIEGTYGDANDDSSYFKVALELPEEQCIIVTNFYFRPGAPKTQRRLWYFCVSVGREPNDFVVQPDSFIGLTLQVRVETVQRDGVNLGNPYVDVARFAAPRPIRHVRPRNYLEFASDISEI